LAHKTRSHAPNGVVGPGEAEVPSHMHGSKHGCAPARLPAKVGKVPTMVWLSGHSQAGTTLLLSLLDGHPQCLVYPDEPSFGRLFTRKDSYKSALHMKNDFLCGMPNPLHFGKEAKLAANLKQRHHAAVDSERPYDEINLRQLASQKKLRGLEQQDFDHAAFFNEYIEYLHNALKNVHEIDPKAVVESTFEALRCTISATRPDLSHGPVLMFKQPNSTLEPNRLNWFFTAWPDGKVIFMRRNPYGRLWSIIKYGEERGDQLTDSPKRYFRRFLRIARDHQTANTIESYPNVLVIWYESLVRQPKHEMGRIAAFLGIENTDVMLISTKLGLPSAVVTNRSTNKSGIGQDSAVKWKYNLDLKEKLIMFFALLMAKTGLDRKAGFGTFIALAVERMSNGAGFREKT